MIVLNFSHPLTAEQRTDLQHKVSEDIERIIEVKVHLDHSRSFADQVQAIVTGLEITPDDWQGQRFVVNLPALAPAAACMLAELHGRMGYFPTIMRLAMVDGSTPPRYVVAELVNLQGVRNVARTQR